MPPLLSFSEVINNNYVTEDAGVVITPAIQSVAIAALALLNNPQSWSDWDDVADDIEALLADAQEALLLVTIPPPEEGMLSEVNLWADRATVQNGNALTLVNNQPATKHGFYTQQNPGSASDHIYFNRWMAAGNWAYAYQYQRTTASGIVEVTIASLAEIVTVIASGDMFGAAADNQMFTGTFTLDESEYKSINIKTIGRNAGNTTNYLNRLTLLQMWRLE